MDRKEVLHFILFDQCEASGLSLVTTTTLSRIEEHVSQRAVRNPVSAKVARSSSLTESSVGPKEELILRPRAVIPSERRTRGNGERQSTHVLLIPSVHPASHDTTDRELSGITNHACSEGAIVRVFACLQPGPHLHDEGGGGWG